MTRNDITLLVLAVLAGALIIAFLFVFGVPLWLGLLVGGGLAVGAVAMRYGLANRRSERQPQQVYQAPQPSPPTSVPVEGLLLPSADRDYRFVFQATVWWRSSAPAGQHPRPSQLAIDSVRERATRLVEGASAGDYGLLAPRVATDLSFPRLDRTGQLEVWAHDVGLTLPGEDRQRLLKLAEVRKDEEVWERERDHERNKRAYLRDDVLASTGTAVVWWLAQDITQVEQTVRLIGPFAQLVAAAHDREVEPVFRPFVEGAAEPALSSDAGEHGTDMVGLVTRLMATVLNGGTEPERAMLADRLATLLTGIGATDAARTIRDVFNAPDFTEPPAYDEPSATEAGALDGQHSTS